MKFKVILISIFSASLVLAEPAQHRHRRPTIKRHASTSAGVNAEYLQLVKGLRSQGAKVKLTTERVGQPFFSVSARMITINDEGLQVFKYANAAAADAEAKLVDPGGRTIGTSKPSWMAPPHFFKAGKLIVLYVGANESILKFLQTSLGAQFAGS